MSFICQNRSVYTRLTQCSVLQHPTGEWARIHADGAFPCTLCRSKPPGASTSLVGSIPAVPDNTTGGRPWRSPAGWVTTPQLIIKDSQLVVPESEWKYW
jgi:hypothetical protein